MSAPHDVPSRPTLAARRVLLVDDDPANRKLGDALLKLAGYEPTVVASVEDALREARRRPPDVILSDVLMPGLDGFQLCLAVRRDPLLAAVPIVLVSSAYTDIGDRKLALQVGASVLVPHTPGLEEAIAAIEAACAPGARAHAPASTVDQQYHASLRRQIDRQMVLARHAEDALSESERRARTLFETVNLVVLGLDAQGVVNYVNPFLLKITGQASEELLGKDWFAVIPEATRSSRRALFREFLEGGGRAHTESAVVTKSGEERMVAWNHTVIRDPEGQAIGTLSIGEDITDRQQLEGQLHQAQKMEAVGRLAGGVAHDFNNVLTAIFGYVEMVIEDLPATSPARADLGEVLKAAGRAASLTRQLLAFSRQQVLQPRVLSVSDVVQDVEKMLRRVIGEDVVLRTVLAPDLGNARADASQLEQVLMNLVVNARDAMPTGGKLSIETANVELTEQYAHAHQPVVPGAYVMLAVSDTGVGMSSEVRARVFEPFFTTKEKGKGTGLGLSTVYGIVKQSGGHVWVYSEEGRGTTFKIYLPRVDAPVETVGRSDLARPLGGTETILVAEDDDVLRPLARALLTKLGYTVLDAANADAAVAHARAHKGPIHLLLSDVVMPGASGRDLARRLAESHPHTKVLYVSGYTDDAIVHHGMLEPGLNYLQKPFTPDALARKVRDVLDAP
jgi:two-component system, cell cycle sensor histidine kinase and response regulator CckA